MHQAYRSMPRILWQQQAVFFQNREMIDIDAGSQFLITASATGVVTGTHDKLGAISGILWDRRLSPPVLFSTPAANHRHRCQ